MCEWKWDVSAYWSKVKQRNFSLLIINCANKQSYSSQSFKASNYYEINISSYSTVRHKRILSTIVMNVLFVHCHTSILNKIGI